MNNKPNPDRSLLHFMLRAQQIAQQDGRSDKGYAMMIVSLVSIAMFSMLAAYTTITNLSKSSTKAYVDGTNTFYVAESGLNRRAAEVREKFVSFATPNGLSPGQATPTTFVSSANMPNCYSQAAATPATANDFECRNYAYQNTKTSTSFKNLNNNNSFGGSNQTIDNLGQVTNYTAFTFVADKTNYLNPTPVGAPRLPLPIVIPAGQQFAGLNALEYVYTIYSTAAKPDPLNLTNPVQQSDAKTVLQMDFRSRIVPLFQFAVFYDGDLEMNSSANMTIGGRVHTNANFYVQPNTTNGAISTTFLGQITAVGSIYNRVDSAAPFNTGGAVNVVTALPDCITGTCVQFPAYSASNTSPLTSAQLTALGGRVSSGTYDPTLKRLETPPPGFIRKRNYYQSGPIKLDSNAGEYYAKADMRLEMVPDRDVTAKTATPWLRNPAIIPFNFTSITATAGTAGTCTTVLPPTDTLGSGVPTPTSDPAANYIASDRNNATNLHCNVFNKGQLQSLRQPVLVLTNTYQTTALLQASERATLGGPATLPTVLPAFTAGNQARILRALQVAIASTPIPIPLDTMNKPFSDPAYAVAGSPSALFRANWTQILTALLPAELANLTVTTISPNQIAAIGGAWFLPAPVQRIENSNPLVQIAANPSNSGFYDGRERRWITMLQTNIASLSVWNRDSLWVNAPNNNLATPYTTTPALQAAAYNGGTGANLADGWAFDRVNAAAVTPTPPAGSLRSLGLGSIDTTEGGLVFHATVSDDLDGDGVMLAANDVTLDIANPIYKRDAPGNLVDASNNPISPPGLIIDYPRRYRGSTNTYQSPFGFAFNGGDFLPAPLTLVTDQAIYIQGNFNNNNAFQATSQATIAANPASGNRLPASIIGDTITILSNQCLANSSTLSNINHLGVLAGQIRCGLPRANTGSVDATVAGNTPTYYAVTGPTAVNAAFLSNTDRSNGDLGVGRNNGGPLRFSGAINNYMHMLEDWGGGGQYFNYTGSFVSLGTPLEFSGAYVSGGGGNAYYGIPARNFRFDANFGAFNLLPPLPPQAIFLRQDVFKRTYN